MRANAQTAGDFRTDGSGGGNWTDVSIWERYNGTVAGWVPSTYAPTSSDGVITITDGDQVNITSNITIDQVVIETNATLIAFSGTVTINNGTGTDVYNDGAFSFNTGSPNLIVNSGAVINGPASPSSYVSFSGDTLRNNGTIYSLLMSSQKLAGTGTIGTLITFRPTSGDILLWDGNQTITTLLNFNYGNISTGNNRLIIAETATVQNNSASDLFVKGQLQMNFPLGVSTKTFRLGDQLDNFTPITITLNKTFGFLNSGVRVGISTSVHPNINSSGIDTSQNVNRFWVVSADSMTFNNATITLSWPASALDPGTDPAQLRAGRWGGSGWSYPATTNPTSTSIQLTGISNTSSGNYIVGELLPIVNIPDAN
ncbi:MAG: hypothetical protein JNK27_01220, partial [Chitinophagaceae bacterium]|nr:hypothetical protein [Chitinophagaceae bacterium]